MSEKGTSLAQYVEHFGLEILNHGDTYETDKVESTNVNRPDLQILGLFDYFDARRIQVMGKAELTYIMKMSENRRTKVFDDLFSYTIPALVLARNMECPAECLQCARNHGRTLLRTTERTADFTSHTMEYLSKQLAPCITRHGVLLDIYGEGVMITGDSGVGKSESAIELIMRGHRLVADDAVEIRLVADQLIGTAPEVIRNYIELRGIGVINVAKLFGFDTSLDKLADFKCDFAGNTVGECGKLFARIDKAEFDKQLAKEAEEKEKKALEGKIDIEDFAKVSLVVGKVVACEPVPKSDKLLKLSVDIGSETRTVASGIAKFYKPDDLVGKKIILVENLKPAMLRGVKSEGMILASGEDDVKVVFIDDSVPVGSKVR